MKQLTMLTSRYKQLLDNFISHVSESDGLTISKTGKHNNKIFFANCIVRPAEPAFIEGLISLLVDIALQENPLFQHSPKLRDMAGDLRGTQLYANLRRGLIRFMKQSPSIHLEGYVAFRMKEYLEKLDMMSYSLIKKMKLIRQD